MDSFSSSISIPTVAVRSGRTYRARVRHKDSSGRWSHWSDPVEFTTTLPDVSDYREGLVISEFMYHPLGPSPAELAAGFDDEEFFEFIELYNAGGVPLDLNDLRFTKGVDFDFLGSAITTLAPGEFVLVVSSKAAFELRYGEGLPIAGEWEGSDRLSNAGERLKLSFGAGDEIHDLTYDDFAPWPVAADGAGPSLTLADPAALPDHAVAVSWRASIAGMGTPGALETDSPFGAWLASQGGSDPLAPYGTSSMPYLLAYSVGADLVPASSGALPLPLVASSGGTDYPALSYRVRQDAAETVNTVEVSGDLVTWESGPGITVPVGEPVDNGDGTLTFTVRSTVPLEGRFRQFLRLRVELSR